MLKFITLLIGCSLTLAVNVQAKEQTDQADAKKQSKKSKTVQTQQVAPKQQPLKTPKTDVQKKVHVDHNAAVPKKQYRMMAPPVSPHVPANVQSNKVHKNKPQFETNAQQQVQANQVNQLPAAPLTRKNVKTYQPRHQNFRAQPKSSIASVRFNKNYQINGAQNWSGNNYRVFRSYRPQWHDQGWWRSHHHHLSLIGGGWYFWDGGYWYPAWGYDNSAAYYPYDGPIYSGPSARPFDQVVADVQAALQEQGYYKGEVDGLLGPLTREALAEYQQANGLYATQTIDQPTLASLGLAG
jgi:hypothetical protein